MTLYKHIQLNIIGGEYNPAIEERKKDLPLDVWCMWNDHELQLAGLGENQESEVEGKEVELNVIV